MRHNNYGICLVIFYIFYLSSHMQLFGTDLCKLLQDNNFLRNLTPWQLKCFFILIHLLSCCPLLG